MGKGRHYSAPMLSSEQEKAHARGDFDFLFPFGKRLLRTDEVAIAIGRSTQYVRELIKAGRLEAHQDSSSGQRGTNLVTRRSVILYLASTASYDSNFVVLHLEAVFKTLRQPFVLDRLIATLKKQRERIN